MYLKTFIHNLVQNGPVVSEKIRFVFLYVYDLGQKSSNDLELQYSHTFLKANKSSVSTNFQVTGFNSF